MRIAILTERLTMGFGVDLVVNEQAKRLCEKGFHVRVYVLKQDGSYGSEAYDVCCLTESIVIKDTSSYDFMCESMRLINNDNNDIVIMQTPPFYDWAPYFYQPTIIIEHGTPDACFFPDNIGAFLSRMVEYKNKVVYTSLKSSDSIVCISNHIKSCLPHDAQSKAVVIHNGCDHYEYIDLNLRKTLRENNSIQQDDIVVLWIGRMQLENDEQPYKNFKLLLELIPKIKKLNKSVKLVFAGKVNHEDIERVNDMGVVCVPNCPSSSMGQLYAMSDIFINLSSWEGFNLSLAEASYQNICVIARNYGPHSEIIRHNLTGFLYEDESELLKFIEFLSENINLSHSLGANSSKLIQNLSWNDNCEKLSKLALDLYDQRPNRLICLIIGTNAYRFIRRIQLNYKYNRNKLGVIPCIKISIFQFFKNNNFRRWEIE